MSPPVIDPVNQLRVKGRIIDLSNTTATAGLVFESLVSGDIYVTGRTNADTNNPIDEAGTIEISLGNIQQPNITDIFVVTNDELFSHTGVFQTYRFPVTSSEFQESFYVSGNLANDWESVHIDMHASPAQANEKIDISEAYLAIEKWTGNVPPGAYIALGNSSVDLNTIIR